MKLKLKNNKGFPWFNNKNIFVKGYILDSDNSVYIENELANYFQGSDNEVVFRENLYKANGCFSIVVENDKYIFAAVDKIRSIPIFYKECNKDICVSDCIYEIQDKEESGIDEVSKKEFLLVGYVTGKNTLDKSIKQLNAGEYLIYDKQTEKLSIKKYFSYVHKDFYDFNEDELINKLQNVHIEVVNNLIKSLKGKTAVIPLSGGYDSRLLVIMLKKLGYHNVICFSYGKKGNEESVISKKIADYLNYKWIFIEYTNEKWRKFIDSDEAQEYFKFASNLTSLPHIQDYIAVREMKENELIPKDSVFIPGHAADFLEGSHLSYEFVLNNKISKELLFKLIYNKHYNLWDWDSYNQEYDKIFREKIEEIINIKDLNSPEEAASLFEEWDWQERQAKFITNSIRVYDFFDYEWRLPLWDNKLLEYWSRINLDLRINRKLYFKYDKVYFEDINMVLNNNNNNNFVDDKKTIRNLKILHKLGLFSLFKGIKHNSKRSHNKGNLEEIYSNHPLQWYSILDFEEFKKEYTGIENINSYLCKLYLKSIE